MARLVNAVVAAVLLLAVAQAAHATTCDVKEPWPYKGANYIKRGASLASGGVVETPKANLTVTAAGNLVLTRKRDGKAVFQTSTTCAGATLQFNGTNLYLQVAGQPAPCWITPPFEASEIAVLTEHCAFDVYAKAPLTNKTFQLNAPSCVEAHIVPHSHDDVGWLLTPQRYYDGCRSPGGGVRGILDTVMQALEQNPNRTYNQVESYFFNRWWQEQDAAMKAKVKGFVQSGQLTFINGGWSMHDEACVHQESAISNMEVGARFLKEELGVELNIGWHIDPFGHASATPRYMAEMGFDAFFFWRTDYEQREYMIQTKELESVWRNSRSLGDKTLMFTSIMPDNYCYGCMDNTCPSQYYSYDCEWSDFAMPLGGRFDARSQAMRAMQEATHAKAQSHVKDLHRKVGFKAQSAAGKNGIVIPPNAGEIAEQYAATIKSYVENFRSGEVLMPWGCDFGHEDAVTDFALMDGVIQYLEEHYDELGVHAFYSTADRYVKAMRAKDFAWPLNEYDYFLDSDNGHAYWSGYLSSRAEYKGYERFLMNQRTASDIAFSAVPPTTVGDFNGSLAKVEVMREAMGVAQHHDSITGTERTAVRNEYQFMLHRGNENISQVTAEVFANVTGLATPPEPCFLSNLSYCPATASLANGAANVSMYLFNPLAQVRTEVLTVPIPTKGLDAFLMPSRTPLRTQVVSTWELTTTIDNTSPTIPAHLPYQAYIEVPNMPPLTLLEVLLVPNSGASNAVDEVLMATDGPTVIANEYYELTFDATTHRLSGVKNLKTGIASAADQSIGHYCPHNNNGQADGAYIMRTCEPHSPLVPYATNFSAMVVAGALCTEVRQKIDAASNIQQAFRLCAGQDYVEIQSGVGEVQTLDTGVEVVMRLRTDIPSNGTWYTDSQAFEMQQRQRDARPNYPYTVTEPVAANFFPCNAFALMNASHGAAAKDPNATMKNMAVMADRSRATASLVDGELQFLVQRRLIYDDNRGVGEPLNERTRVLTTSRIVFNEAQGTLTTAMRLQSQRMTHMPLMRFGAPSGKTQPFPYLSEQATNLLPPNVHLHTRTVHQRGEMLLRLQHLFDIGEGPLAVPVAVQLGNVLPAGARVTSITDMDMNGVKVAATMQRTDFSTCDHGTLVTVPPVPMGGSSPAVNATSLPGITMHPMEIRALRILFDWA